MRRDIRKKEVRLRKNFFPTLVLILTLWGLLAGLIYFVEPDSLFALPAFFLLLFFSLLFTLSTLFANSRRGFIGATAASLFLLMRFWGIGNVVNLLLILGLTIAAEIYFGRANHS